MNGKEKNILWWAQTTIHVIWAIIRHPHPSFVISAHCLCCPHRRSCVALLWHRLKNRRFRQKKGSSGKRVVLVKVCGCSKTSPRKWISEKIKKGIIKETYLSVLVFLFFLHLPIPHRQHSCKWKNEARDRFQCVSSPSSSSSFVVYLNIIEIIS